MLAPCASCGKRVSDRASVCPFCRTPRAAAVSAAPAAAEPSSLAAAKPAAPPPSAAPPVVEALAKFQRGDFIGDKIQVIDVLGEGGFGIVYLVASLDSQSTYALKTLRGELLRDPKTREMFRKEAQIWIDLGPHPNLVRANWITEISGRLYIGMQYVQSKGGRPNSLEGYLEKRPPSLAQALLWSIQFCHGMEYAVSKGIRCHRDIKPANILIGEDGAVRISDFGIAGLALTPDAPAPEAAPKAGFETGRTVAGSVFGTPTHMSPEQFRDAASCDERSDVYSFGVVLYQMAASGGLPFLPAPPAPGSDPMAWYWHQFRAMHQGTPPPPLASPLFPAIARCLAKAPGDRYPTFRALRGDLEMLYRKESGHEPPAPPSSEESASDLQNRAISLGELGRHAEALDVFDRALAQAPNEPAIWNSKGLALRALDRIDEALASFDKASALDPLFALPWVNKGLVYADVQRNEEALRCFDRCLGLSPRDVAAWIAKGVVLGRLGRSDEELLCMQKAVEIDPRSSTAWFNIGNLLSSAKRPSEALQAYDRALASDPRYAAAWCGKAIVLGEIGKPGDAVAAFDEALRIDPKDGQTWYNKGNLLIQIDRLPDARGCFDQATRIAPGFALGWYNRGLADYQLGRHQEAAGGFAEFTKRAPQHALAAEARRLQQLIGEGKAPAIRTSIGERAEWQQEAKDGTALPDLVIPPVAPAAPKAPPPVEPAKRWSKSYPPPRTRPEGSVADWNDRCLELFRRKQYAEALACTDQGMLLDARNATTLNNRANCLFFLGKRDEALALQHQVLEIQPAFLGSWLNKSAIENALGRKPEAARSLAEILELGRGEDASEVRQAKAERAKLEREGVQPAPRGYLGLLALGYQAMVDRRYDRALECYDEAASLAPQNPEVWRWRGDALGAMKRFEEALQNYDQGLQRAPKDAQLWHDKGKTYVKMRLHAEAIEAFDRSIELDPEYAGSWSDRGKMLGVLKRREEAAESLARAVLLAPHHPAPWQNKALLEEELGRDGDALHSYREFLKRAAPDMRLQIEHAKARIPLLEARVRAAGGDVSAPRVAAAGLPRPASPAPGLPAVAIPAAQVPKVMPGAPFPDCLKRGEVSLNQGQAEKALAWYEQAIVGDPRSYQAWAGAAEAYLALKKHRECVGHFDRALELNPRYVIGWQRRGAALEALRLYDAALQSWDKGIELAPQNLQLWNGRGLALFHLGRHQEAIQSFDKALAIDPRFSLAKFNKAHCEDRLARRDDAIKSFQQFLALAPPHLSAQIQQARQRVQELRGA